MDTAIPAEYGLSRVGEFVTNASCKVWLLNISKYVFKPHERPWLAIVLVRFHHFHAKSNIVLIQVDSVICPSRYGNKAGGCYIWNDLPLLRVYCERKWTSKKCIIIHWRVRKIVSQTPRLRAQIKQHVIRLTRHGDSVLCRKRCKDGYYVCALIAGLDGTVKVTDGQRNVSALGRLCYSRARHPVERNPPNIR